MYHNNLVVIVYWNPVCVSIPQLQLTVEFLESLIWIMQDIGILLLSQMKNCMQSEGKLRFFISLYEIFVNLDFKTHLWKVFAIQSRNMIHKRMNGEEWEGWETCLQFAKVLEVRFCAVAFFCFWEVLRSWLPVWCFELWNRTIGPRVLKFGWLLLLYNLVFT